MCRTHMKDDFPCDVTVLFIGTEFVLPNHAVVAC